MFKIYFIKFQIAKIITDFNNTKKKVLILYVNFNLTIAWSCRGSRALIQNHAELNRFLKRNFLTCCSYSYYSSTILLTKEISLYGCIYFLSIEQYMYCNYLLSSLSCHKF